MRRSPKSSDAGFALVEAIIGCFLVAAAAAGVAATMAATAKTTGTSRSTTIAVAFARTQMEDTRSHGYADLAHLTGVHAADPAIVAGTFDPDGSGPLAAEPVVYAADGIASLVATHEEAGTTFTARTYVTDSPTVAKRITTLVSWTQGGVGRTTSLSTLVPPAASPTSAAADVYSGEVGGTAVTPVLASAVRRGGGADSAGPETTSPRSGWSITSASTEAEVDPAATHTAVVDVPSATITESGLTIVVSGARVVLESSASGSTENLTAGTVTVNGVQYVDPAPGTEVVAGGWTVTLNDERTSADGSTSVSLVRLRAAGTDVRLGWAWVGAVIP